MIEKIKYRICIYVSPNWLLIYIIYVNICSLYAIYAIYIILIRN